MNNNSGETKWKKCAFRKKRSNITSDDYEIQLMNTKIRNVKKKATNYKNVPELNDVYEMPYAETTVEGFLDNPEHNNNFTSIADCIKNGDPAKCDYEGIIYPDKSTAIKFNTSLVSGINTFFQNFESINMKIAKYTYTAFSGAQNVIRHGYDYKMDIFLKDISYYDIELATESTSDAANPSNNQMISDFNKRKDKSEEYDRFVCRRLAEDIKQAIDNKMNNKSFSLKYIPQDLRNSDPNEDLNLAKYIHDIILIKDYFGIFEAEILCVWCLYNLYFFIYKGKDMPEISRMGLFLKTLENHYLFVIEFVFSTTLAFPEILTNIKNKMRELAEYKDAVLTNDFRILKNIISNKASIMIILFVFLLLFLATIGKFLKRFLLIIAKFDIAALVGATGISVGVCYAIALLAYCFYLPDLVKEGRAGTLKVIGYFFGYMESSLKLGPIGLVLFALLMIFHFVINIVIAVPLGMIITVLYFLFCIFAGIFYLADLTAFARIDKEIDSDLEFEINRAKEKSTEVGHSIWSNIYYIILLIIKFIYNMKHSIALIIICSIVLNDIQKNASNVAVCNYIFVPVLIIAIIMFCYMTGTVYAKKIVDSLKGFVTTAAPVATSSPVAVAAPSGTSIAEGITNLTSSLNPTLLAAPDTTDKGNLSTLIGDASKSPSSVLKESADYLGKRSKET